MIIRHSIEIRLNVMAVTDHGNVDMNSGTGIESVIKVILSHTHTKYQCSTLKPPITSPRNERPQQESICTSADLGRIDIQLKVGRLLPINGG